MAEYWLTPAAQLDVDQIFDHSVRRWGLAQALRYKESLESALSLLVGEPAQSQDCSHIRPGYRRRLVGRHYIYFHATDYGIAIVRILHDRMDAQRHVLRH